MSEAKFTKGEWHMRDDEIGIVDKSDTQSFGMMNTICYVDMHDFGKDEGKANAHLIAAAPEMYEDIERDLESLYRFVKTLAEYSDDWLFYTNEIKRKECLLAKARGEHD